MSYVPPGWTSERLAAATADELLQLDYSVRLLLLQKCAWLMANRRFTLFLQWLSRPPQPKT